MPRISKFGELILKEEVLNKEPSGKIPHLESSKASEE